MQRVLDPTQIEAFAERQFPRIRLPEGDQLFARRALRLRELSAAEGPGRGRSIADYLKLMAVVADAQHAAFAALPSLDASAPFRVDATDIELARRHGMPPLLAVGRARDTSWRAVLDRICAAALESSDLTRLPEEVRTTCTRLRVAPAGLLEAQADAVLGLHSDEVDAATAPFVMAALQVYWLALERTLVATEVSPLSVPGICPVCGTLPVASVVRVDRGANGHRYLHCALCAAEWHLVRVSCSQCQNVKDLGYYSIEGGNSAVQAEACPECRSYRKILYQEKDADVEPVADDLASLALDLLMAEAGYQRGSGNPLLWQQP